MPAHVRDTLRFDQLDAVGKVRSINAMVNNLGAAMANRIREGGSAAEQRRRRTLYQDQLRRLSGRL